MYSRTGPGTRCPYCAGKLPIPGENDLATRFPEVAAQWHPTKNAPLTPEQVLPGSHRRVWWQCEKGHEWQAIVKSRTVGCGCPVCTNRQIAQGENDLAAIYPELAAQWHPTRNGKLTPQEVSTGTPRKVWWRCEKGHEWQASVLSRTHGTGCPVCAGKVILPGRNDLASLFPEIAAQWHPTRNGALTPERVSPYSNRKVWWRCGLGHEYQATVGARAKADSGCPYCGGRRVLAGFNDLATLAPEVAVQWHPTLNGNLTSSMVTVGSHRKAWWLCPEGHVWKAAVYSRTGVRLSGVRGQGPGGQSLPL